MRLVLPVHQGRISPLFDTARRALLAEIEEGAESRTELRLPGGDPVDQVRALIDQRADALVCGAIGQSMLHELLRHGLRVWPCVAGEVKQIIMSLKSQGSLGMEFMMPGCSGPREGLWHGHQLAGSRWGWRLPPEFVVDWREGRDFVGVQKNVGTGCTSRQE